MAGFSTEVYSQVMERSHGSSELSGKTQFLQLCRIDHDKYMFPKLHYHPSNAMLVTDIEHLEYHRMCMSQPWRIGLTEHQNNVTVRLLERKVLERRGLSELNETLIQDIQDAQSRWCQYFAMQPCCEP